MGRHRFLTRCTVLLALLLSAVACAVDAGSSGEGDDAPAADDLVARWWNWAAAPEPGNPVSDRDGSSCAVNQPGDVWFLAGSWGETVRRSCAIPADVPVFGPVGNTVCEVRRGESVEVAAEVCVYDWSLTRVLLDGEKVPVKSRTSDGVFRLALPPGNPVFDDADGTIDAYGSGVWFGPLVLDEGAHTLRIVARADGFALDVTYRLTVGSPAGG